MQQAGWRTPKLHAGKDIWGPDAHMHKLSLLLPHTEQMYHTVSFPFLFCCTNNFQTILYLLCLSITASPCK